MTIKQISVFIENKPGCLAAFTDVLSKNHIGMRALSIAETPDFGILRIIVDDHQKTADVLKENGYVFSVTKVLAVAIPDEPGSLYAILKTLGENDINVEYTYAFTSRQADTAYMVFRVADNEKAIKILSENGIKISCTEDLISL